MSLLLSIARQFAVCVELFPDLNPSKLSKSVAQSIEQASRTFISAGHAAPPLRWHFVSSFGARQRGKTDESRPSHTDNFQ